MAIAMDTLNQISLMLRSDRSITDRLRKVLLAIFQLPEYQHWEESTQYSGRRFRLPRRFISSTVGERRLLEALRFVIDDALEVKLNYLDDQLVFVTDGLFVPADFRVFPWHDESDVLMAKLAREEWTHWPTTVIDPATGCGHNALRIQTSQRFGFDISVRALSFAAVNSQLNDRPFSALALADIEQGTPFILDRDAERILFVANLPFAIEPVSGALVRTAAGGESGYRYTVAAMEAVADYASRVSSSVRAVVLTYSVGSVADDRWAAVEEAKRIFGSENIDWEILSDQRLWRINGKKEQPNPMPLSSLRLKADCQYYVRDPNMRDPLRAGYIEKERQLRREGYDALAYGVLSVEMAG